MKILHTADWHLGKRLERFDRGAEQNRVLDEICAIAEAEQVDAVVVAGDLFDTYNPPIDASERFYRALKRLSAEGKRPVIAIAGNHDSPDRVEAPDPLARECGIIFTGYPHSKIPPFALESGLKVLQSDEGFVELAIPGLDHPLRVVLAPYANEVRLKKDLGVEDPEARLRDVLEKHWRQIARKYCDTLGVNIMVAHLFMVRKGDTPPEEPEDERAINIGGAQMVFTENLPEELQYVALGHLHRFQTMDRKPCPVIYSGSPLEYSFAEAKQQKFVVIVEVEPGETATYRSVPLESGMRLVRQTFSDVDYAVQWLEDNPNKYVELSVISEDYLTSADRKRLMAAHERIIGPIPILTKNHTEGSEMPQIDLQKGMEALFKDYFQYRHGQQPNEQLVHLFREILGTEEMP